MTADDTHMIRAFLDDVASGYDEGDLPDRAEVVQDCLERLAAENERLTREQAEVKESARVLLNERRELQAENEQLRAVANGLLWLNDNRHNYGSPRWLDYFDAAVVDARAALAGGVGDTAAALVAGMPSDLVAVLRDQGVVIEKDADVWALIGKWTNAPSNTAPGASGDTAA